MPFTSTWNGWCLYCKKPVKIGQKVEKVKEGQFAKKWIHYEPCFKSLSVDTGRKKADELIKSFSPTLWIHSCPTIEIENIKSGSTDSCEVKILTTEPCKKCGSMYVPGKYKTEKPVAQFPVNSIQGLMNKQDKEELELEELGIVKKKWIPSVFQENIFEEVKNGSGNLMIEAVAGSGKTTTIVECLSFTTTDDVVGFLAFNKHIVKELSRRAPNHVHVSTIHSLGLSLLREEFDNVEIDEDGSKLSGIFNKYLPCSNVIEKKLRTENRAKRVVMYRMVALAKATLVDFNNKSEVQEMCDRFSIFGEDVNMDDLFVLLPKIMEDCSNIGEGKLIVDFDDIIWLPVYLGIIKPRFTILFVDEAQDLNKAQIMLILACVGETGRIICVGDRNQSLYGFRGADTDAIPNIIKYTNSKTLPLSVSYRCPKSHIINVQRIVPEIQYSDFAIEGKIERIKSKDFSSMIQRGDMIICRTNAPLIPYAFDCIRKGILR